jgi:hypothetical protein
MWARIKHDQAQGTNTMVVNITFTTVTSGWTDLLTFSLAFTWTYVMILWRPVVELE